MSDHAEHNPGDHEDPLPGPTWIVTFLGVVLLAVIILGITAIYYNEYQREDVRKVVQTDPQELTNLRAAQQARLHEKPRFVEVIEKNDKGDDVVVKALQIPIEDAMQAVVASAGKAAN